MLKGRVLSAVLVLMISLAAPSYAQDADMSAILKRLEKLEQENKRLNNEVSSLKVAVQEAQQKAAQPTEAAAATKIKPVVTTKVPIDMYGYVKGDVVYNDSAADTLAMNAPRENTNKDNDEFNFTANETRIGFNLGGLDVPGGGKFLAKIETDFWNGEESTAANTPQLRLRQGYVQFEQTKWDLLLGQTWDFISPLNPSTLNFGIAWRAGNIGDRHPQLTFTKKNTKLLGGEVTTKFGLIDSNDDSQERRGFPIVGAYTSLKRKVLGKTTTLGIGGMYGQAEVTAISSDVPIWAGTVTFETLLTNKLSLKGEGFVGQRLNQFRGGSSIGIAHNKSVRSTGGWFQFAYQATEKLQTNIGAGIDDVLTDRQAADSTDLWGKNVTYFLNLKYRILKNVVLGIEYQGFNTLYQDGVKGDLNRIQSSVIYEF